MLCFIFIGHFRIFFLFLRDVCLQSSVFIFCFAVLRIAGTQLTVNSCRASSWRTTDHQRQLCVVYFSIWHAGNISLMYFDAFSVYLSSPSVVYIFVCTYLLQCRNKKTSTRTHLWVFINAIATDLIVTNRCRGDKLISSSFACRHIRHIRHIRLIRLISTHFLFLV